MTTRLTSQVIQHLRKDVLLQERSEMTDGRLLECFIEHRDETAFAALVKRHGPMVWGVCRRLLSHHDAEDAFQATFLVLVRKAASIVPREMVANWLYGVAHQTALHSRRATARRRTRERQVTQMPELAVAEEDHRHDLQPLIDQELSRIPDMYRVAIVLCDLEGKTRKEAARQLGCPEGTVAAHLARGRALLAKRLARHGLAVSSGTVAALLSQSTASGHVPLSVVSSTIKTAVLVAAGQAVAAGMMSAKVAALAEGVLKAMTLTKYKTMLVLVGTLSAFAVGLGLCAYPGFAQQAVTENTTEIVKEAAQTPASKAGDESFKEAADTHYCWLVFGPKKVRALVRLKGDELAVDRDGDGKFGSKVERFPSAKECKDVVIADAHGKTSYVITSAQLLHVVPPEKFLAVRARIRGACSYPQCAIVQMADEPKGAPQAHFHGPLTMVPSGWRIVNRASRVLENDLVNIDWLLPQEVKRLAGKELAPESTLPESLKRTGEPTNLFACIATDGENSHVAVCSPAETEEGKREIAPFPKGTHPFVDVEFPPKKSGDPPLKKRYPLDQFCCDGLYRGPVRVPDDAGVGKAKVTFSFAGLKGVKVASSTVEIAIDGPQDEKKDHHK
jgi:RNA polymerase sigma factor (sigma-70 family)